MEATIPANQTFNSLWAKGRIRAIRYLAMLRKRWWIVLLTISLGLCGAAWFVHQMPPAFLSVGRMMVSGQIRLSEGSVYSEELVNFFGTQLELMQSGEVRTRAIARVQALHPELPPEPVSFEAAQLRGASIFVMRAIGKSPTYTQAYLDACMEEYINSKKQMRSRKSDSTAAALADELVRLEKQMQADEEEMHDFQKTNNIGFLHEEGNSAGIYLAQLNRQLADLRTEYDLLKLLDLDQNLDREHITSNATAATARPDSTLASFGPTAEYQRAKQQMQMLEAERADLSRYLKPKHPTIVAIDDQISKGDKLIETFRTQSVETLKTRRESIRLQIENLERVAKEWDLKAVDLARRIAEFEKLKSKGERTKSQYDRVLVNMRNIDVTKNVDQDTISILEKASPAISVKPGLQKIIWQGFAIGAALGLLILFIMDKLDDRIGSFIEFRSHFPEHILGQIPHERSASALLLLTHNDERHAMMESFRTLRSSILFLPVAGERPKTLMVTSSVPGEGKTTIASNLAIILAFSGARTLLVDADLRRGRVHDLFGIKSGGFASVLQQRATWREAVVESGIQNLSIIPRGKPLSHPAEHFLGKVTDQFLRDTYNEFDYVIFDSAPVMVADDALSLAPKIDGVLFVVRFSVTSAHMGRRSLGLLAQRQVNVLGLVCNDVRLSESEYGYSYYTQYSDAYSQTGVEA